MGLDNCVSLLKKDWTTNINAHVKSAKNQKIIVSRIPRQIVVEHSYYILEGLGWCGVIELNLVIKNYSQLFPFTLYRYLISLY